MRRLILNADDFGLTSGVNRAILESHSRGVLTSATLMANAPATQEAIAAANANSGPSVGCHLVLIDGTPLIDPAHLSTLLPRGKSGFRRSIGAFAARALTGRIDPEEVELEASAQFRKLQDAGVSLTHFDTHKHTHMFPPILEGILRAARTCGVRAVRNPFEPSLPVVANIQRPSGSRTREMETRILRMLRPRFQRMVNRAGLKTTDGTVGVAATGTLDAEIFRQIVHSLPEGTWEFVVHPGYCDEALRGAHTRLLESRELELQVLTAPETREWLALEQIHLISYAEL